MFFFVFFDLFDFIDIYIYIYMYIYIFFVVFFLKKMFLCYSHSGRSKVTHVTVGRDTDHAQFESLQS